MSKRLAAIVFATLLAAVGGWAAFRSGWFASAAADPPCPASATACAFAPSGAPTALPEPPRAEAARTPRLLEFEMPGCSACRKMAPVVHDLEKRCSKGRDVVEHVDVVKPEGEALAEKYGVRELPTFLAVDAEGREVIRLAGVQKPEMIAAVITEVTGDGCSVD